MMADLVSLRQSVALTIWPNGGGSLPSNMTPSTIEANITLPDLTKLTWNISCEFFWLNATAYHSVQSVGQRSDTIIVHHHGHAHGCDTTLPDSRCDSVRSFYDFYNVTDFYHRELEADIFFLYMPLLGPNAQQGLPTSHTWFEQWQEKGVSTIRFFVEPAVQTINYALALVGLVGSQPRMCRDLDQDSGY